MSHYSVIYGDAYNRIHQQNLATYEKSQEELKRGNPSRIYDYDANRSQVYEQLLDDRAVVIDPQETHGFQSMYNWQAEKSTGNYKRCAVRGIQNRTLLSDLFFSDANRKHLDERIRYAVYKMSDKQYKLGPQDPTPLFIVMRSVWLQYNFNHKCHIKEQVRRLNDIVVKEIAPDLLSNATQYVKYLEDANEGHKAILPRPINVNDTGTRILVISDGLGFPGYRQVE